MNNPHFEMIPLIRSHNTPQEVQDELTNWNCEISFHYQTTVETFWTDHVKELPLFFAWLLKIGAISSEQFDELANAPTGNKHFSIGIGE